MQEIIKTLNLVRTIKSNFENFKQRHTSDFHSICKTRTLSLFNKPITRLPKKFQSLLDLSQPVSSRLQSLELCPSLRQTYSQLVIRCAREKVILPHSKSQLHPFRMDQILDAKRPNSSKVVLRFCFFCGVFLDDAGKRNHFKKRHGGVQAHVMVYNKTIEMVLGKNQKINLYYSVFQEERREGEAGEGEEVDMGAREYSLDLEALAKVKRDIVNLNF